MLVHRITARWRTSLRIPARLFGNVSVIGLGMVLMAAVVYGLRSLRFDLGRVSEMPERSIVLDRFDKELGRIHGENREVVPIEAVSPNFLNALLAREDKSFHHHPGVDPRGVARAIYQNLKRGRLAQGSSTITMQLARNTYPLEWSPPPEPPRGGPWNRFVYPALWNLTKPAPALREFDRKLLELAVSFRIETAYSKDEILEHYVNRIFWGGSIHGVEAAARTYLEKPARSLTLGEGAMLAGSIRAPNAFSPFDDLDRTRRERDDTLDSMVKYGFATEDEARAARNEPLHIRPPDRRIIHDTYAMDAIRRDLDVILTRENIKLGGLTIVTTIDKNLQEAAARFLDKHLRALERRPGYRHQTRTAWQSLPPDNRPDPAYVQGAAAVIENRTGAVLAVVGGRDADESKFNRALHARRQVGSVFKPFVYLSALDRGLRPDTWIEDGPLRPGELDHAPADWSPRNADGKYYKLVTLREALMKSRNTSSVRVGDFAGIANVAEVARKAGFTTELPRTPASYLGSWEASPWEVASAYSLLPNGGTRYRPFLILEIRDRSGSVLYRTPPLGYRAARAGAAASVSSILETATRRGTAAGMRSRHDFHRPAAGKTGTTDNFHDAWFAGYCSSLTCAVWVGLDQPQPITSGGYGSALALPIWVDVMKTADRLQRYKFGPIQHPVEYTSCRLCRFSAKRATAGCEQAGAAYDDRVPSGLLPAENDFCTIHPLRAQAVGDPPPPPRKQPLRAIPVD